MARYFAGRRPVDMFADIEAASGVRLPAKFPLAVSAAILTRLQQELRPIPACDARADLAARAEMRGVVILARKGPDQSRDDRA